MQDVGKNKQLSRVQAGTDQLPPSSFPPYVFFLTSAETSPASHHVDHHASEANWTFHALVIASKHRRTASTSRRMLIVKCRFARPTSAFSVLGPQGSKHQRRFGGVISRLREWKMLLLLGRCLL